MQRVLIFLFVIALIIALALTIFDPENSLTPAAQAAAGVMLLIIVLNYLTAAIKRPRTSIAPSMIAEIERLYFRAMREMLNDSPNLPQVINDFQHILSLDPHYKNARYFYHRALILQKDATPEANGHITRDRTSFMRVQEKLIDLDPAVRKAVVMELIHYGDLAVDPLTALLMDEDPDVRVHAATALGWIGGLDAVQPLLVALQDPDSLVRRYAARALCWVVDESAVEGLIVALDDEDSYVRSYAARALGWSQDERAVEPLRQLLEDNNTDVYSYALTALEDLGHKDVRKARVPER